MSQSQVLSWIPSSSWLAIEKISLLPAFTNLIPHITAHPRDWKSWWDSEMADPDKIPLQTPHEFHKLLIIRCLRPDRLENVFQTFSTKVLGSDVSLGLGPHIEDTINDSTPDIPVLMFLYRGNFVIIFKLFFFLPFTSCGPLLFLSLFITFLGLPIIFQISFFYACFQDSDPTAMLNSAAKRRKVALNVVSLGQLQENNARHELKHAMKRGGWLLLHNCHLSADFLPEVVSMLSMGIDLDEEVSKPTASRPSNALTSSALSDVANRRVSIGNDVSQLTAPLDSILPPTISGILTPGNQTSWLFPASQPNSSDKVYVPLASGNSISTNISTTRNIASHKNETLYTEEKDEAKEEEPEYRFSGKFHPNFRVSTAQA